MAEVIAAHVLWMSGETETVWQPAEESAQCSCGHEYDTWVHTAGGDESPDWDKEHATHLAEELAKAGYGLLPDVAPEYGAQMMTHGGRAGQPIGHGPVRSPNWWNKSTHMRLVGPWQELEPLPNPLAAALADPEGHALVKAIHDRKAEAGGN